MKIIGILRTSALAVLASVASTQAQSFTAIYIEDNPTMARSGTFDGSNYIVLNAGVCRFVGFEAFCIEPLATLPAGPIDYDHFTPFTAPVSDAIAQLVGQYYTTTQTNVEAAATQWAIWEILNDGLGSPSLSAGNTQVTDPAVSNLADTYLGNLGSLTPAEVAYVTNPTYQDVVGLSASIFKAPEPTSLGLLATSALLLLRRRRN